MKLNVRLAVTISLVSAVNILILTLLMHLKFHMTNMGLLQDSITVATYSFVKNIKDSTESGIPLESISYIPKKIDNIKHRNSIIKNVYVFSIVDNNLVDIFLENKEALPENIKQELMKSINSSKSTTWGFDGDDYKFSFVGNTIRDNVGNDRAAVVLTYAKNTTDNSETKEIHNLYKRMGAALILCILVSFIMGYYYTHPIEKQISHILEIFKKIKNKEQYSTAEISDKNIKQSLEIILADIKNVDQELCIFEAEIKGDHNA